MDLAEDGTSNLNPRFKPKPCFIFIHTTYRIAARRSANKKGSRLFLQPPKQTWYVSPRTHSRQSFLSTLTDDAFRAKSHRLSPSTFLTPLLNTRKINTSSSDLCNRQTPTSWTSNVPVRFSKPDPPCFSCDSTGPHNSCMPPGCFAITTVFSHAQTVVVCAACSGVLCQPTGGKARLTEGAQP